jgi:hypothetical protein
MGSQRRAIRASFKHFEFNRILGSMENAIHIHYRSVPKGCQEKPNGRGVSGRKTVSVLKKIDKRERIGYSIRKKPFFKAEMVRNVNNEKELLS